MPRKTPTRSAAPRPARGADKQEAILAAAFRAFRLYGFRRTSMEDIARETGVSRASLYAHFANKEEIFRSLSSSLHENALADAESALRRSGAASPAIGERVEAALLARLGRLHAVVVDSPHGEEILDESNRLCGDVVADSTQRFRKMLAGALRAADQSGEIDLRGRGLTPAAAAQLISLAANGLKKGATRTDSFERRVRDFVAIFFAGLE